MYDNVNIFQPMVGADVPTLGLDNVSEAVNKDTGEIVTKGRLGNLNVCLAGGCNFATSRGEIIKPLPVADYDVTLIKPKNLGISAKEAYAKYSMMRNKPNYSKTENLMFALLREADIKSFLYNDLEVAVFKDYKELQKIKEAYPDSIMTGSGSTYFELENVKNSILNEEYQVINGIKFINHGVCEC